MKKTRKAKWEYLVLAHQNDPTDVEAYNNALKSHEASMDDWINSTGFFWRRTRKPAPFSRPRPKMEWMCPKGRFEFMNEAIDAIAEDGWELVLAKDSNCLIFKRPPNNL